MIKRFERNLKGGKDYVVGDIHGCFAQLEQALSYLDFNKSADRLFCVGDLVNRGNESIKALHYLNEPWFFSVLGNHDWMIAYLPDDIKRFARNHNVCLDWVHEVEQKMFHELQDKMRQMPLLIEVETNYGKVGIVHAEVRPTYASWQEVIEKAQSYTSTQFAENSFMLTGRSRVRKQNQLQIDRIVEGIDYVISGHTTVNQYEQHGNSIFIDAGLVYGINHKLIDGKPAGLTFFEIESKTIHHFKAEHLKLSEKVDITIPIQSKIH